MRQFIEDKCGQGLVEYAMALLLVAIVVTVVLAFLGPQIGGMFSQLTVAAFETPAPTGPPSGPPGPPPDCYGSLLLSIMVGLMGAAVLISARLPRKPLMLIAH